MRLPVHSIHPPTVKQPKSYFKTVIFLTVWFAIFLFKPVGSNAQDNEVQKASFQPIQVREGFSESNLFGHLYLLSTPDSSLSVEDILKRDKYFRLVESELPGFGMDSRYHWIRFDVVNAGRQSQSLVSNLHYKEFNELAFYIVDEKGRVQFRQEHFNRKTPIARKPFPTRYFAFPITIKPGQHLTILWCSQRDESVSSMPLKLFSKADFFEYLFTADFLLYFALGIVAVAFVLTIILYIVTRRLLLLYYSGYALFSWLSVSNLEGFLTQFVDLNIPFVDENINILFMSITGIFMVLFSVDFLQTRAYAPGWVCKFARIFLYISSTFIIYAWLSPFSGFNAAVGSLIGIIPIVLVAIMIVYGIMARKYEAFLYLIAATPMLLMSGWFVTSILFGYSRTWLFFDIAHYSSLCEIVVLGAGIGYKLIHDRNEYLLELNRLQKQFTSSILQTQDMERQRIAADLHDDLGGTLATIKRSITDLIAESTAPETLRKFKNLEPLIQKSSEDLRRISHNLMPPEFERIGLANSLAQLIGAIPRAPTRFEFLCSGSEQRLGKDIELNAYRIVSELVQNILKHAQAKRAAVQLIYFDHFLRILVEDDGIGSNAEAVTSQSPGIGLRNCILRADYIGATLTRETSGGGSLVMLDIPFQAVSQTIK